MGKKILCIALTVLLTLGCLSGCAEQAVVTNPNGLMYATFDEFFANSKHLHPETDENLRYALYDNFVEVIECISNAETIVIPDTYKGRPVISIDKEAFAKNKSIKHLTIGNNVLRIHTSAFQDCESLMHVTMSSSVNEISEYAFKNCKSLTNIIIPPRVSTIYAGTFEGCKSLSKVVIESSDMLDDETSKVTDGREIIDEAGRTLEGGSFGGCEKLAIMWIPEDIQIVDDSILGHDSREPLICGGDASASSQFATNQRLDYMLVDRDDFDAQARLFENVNVIDRTEVGQTITVGNFKVTLEEVNYYNKLGSIIVDDNHTLLVATFDITQSTQIVQYFDGLNVTCTSTAPGKDNIVQDFNKIPLMMSSEVLGLGYPVGNINPDTHLKGVIVLKVSDRFESVSIKFAGAESAFII
jgi:hypothetical protein